MKTLSALILAAGSGRRANTAYPKQYMLIDGTSILRRSLDPFLAHPQIETVHIVISRGTEDLYAQAVKGLSLPKPIIGGKTRTESARNGLAKVTTDHVLIHDGCRPFITRRVIDAVITGLQKHRAVVPIVPMLESIKDGLGHNIDRDTLHVAQTPQGFETGLLQQAYRRIKGVFTDDATLAQGITPVHMVAGDPKNKKITLSEDFSENSPKNIERWTFPTGAIPHIGHGYDVHAFGSKAQNIRLCGVTIPHDRSLSAHSDGDVALHAVADALYGAMGDGDIGQHFPPTQSLWGNCDSSLFLNHALKRLHKRGGCVSNVDITIVCERPKITPYRTVMKKAVAQLIQIPQTRVSVKATTEEGLGFTGRGEGIACHAHILAMLKSQRMQT